MSRHLRLAQSELAQESVLATVVALGCALVLTDTEIVRVKAGWFGNRIDRYPLADLAWSQLIPNTGASLLMLFFRGDPPVRLLFMYYGREEESFALFVSLLQPRELAKAA